MRILIAAACCYLAGCGDGEAPKTFDPHHHPDVVSLHNEAVAAMGAYDYDTALRVLNDLTVAHPTWREAQIDHAIAQLNRQSVGDDGKALDRLARVLADDPTNVRAHFVAGILRLHAGQIEEAKQHFEVVTSRDASDAYAAYYLGQALMQLGDIEASVPWFTLAVELDPYFRSAYYAGAQAARRVGQS
ncbi:MAG: tetratricopeptide repeat protein [Planctomycetes bacterium]|nr:tetratricopeptide repeat protein [Planctomycetota bacterium]